jgi:hypothetical protein
MELQTTFHVDRLVIFMSQYVHNKSPREIMYQWLPSPLAQRYSCFNLAHARTSMKVLKYSRILELNQHIGRL